MNPLLQVLGASHVLGCYTSVERVTKEVVTGLKSESKAMLLQMCRTSHARGCYMERERVTLRVVTGYLSESERQLLHL
jgi:hypothetical protein